MTKKDDELLKLEIARDVKAQADKDYAIKLVEVIVFGLCGILLTGIIGALMLLIIRK